MDKLPHYTAASLSLDEIETKANDKDSLISKLQSSIDKICAPQDRANEEEERKREIVDTKILTRFKKELSRYKIKLSLGDIDSLIVPNKGAIKLPNRIVKP